MAARHRHPSALRVTARTPSLTYDLRWYDNSGSIVPLWWLGIEDSCDGDLVFTDVLHGDDGTAPDRLRTWLAASVPGPMADHLVALVASVATAPVRIAV